MLAVEIGQLAVDGLRRLSENDEETYRPLLAAALTMTSTTLSETGRPTEGLPSIEEAVTHYRALAQADLTRFLPNLTTSLNNQARILDGLGWSTEAVHLFDVMLAEHAEPTWAQGVLLLARAHWLATTEGVAAATDDAAQATDLFQAAGDRRRGGQARQLLRTMRVDHPAAVDEAWSARSDALPVWLRLPTIDPAAAQLLIDWVRTTSWPESFDFLAAHAPTLLTDRAEASLEHLIDNNPGNTDLDQHLGILCAAREQASTRSVPGSSTEWPRSTWLLSLGNGSTPGTGQRQPNT
ncbi:MAG: hypothetical protein ACRDTC_23490 [Pseudonocardiaceae bacterium]